VYSLSTRGGIELGTHLRDDIRVRRARNPVVVEEFPAVRADNVLVRLGPA